ncbi:MAG: carbohydrate binding family 9 domain-containing protein [Flavobacteriaceae bacterium]|nr:carbohydrate binding family 9 domain-containing protein [Flavobacteriaceae bacterium]
MKKNRTFLYFTLLFSFFKLIAQQKQFTVKYINSPITIDAKLDESVWSLADSAKDFWQYFPSDSIQAKQQSDIKMLFDDKNLYVGIKIDASGQDYIIPSLRRDFRARGNDNISLIFDTFNDGTNAFFFGTNPYGVLREALISGGGTDLRGFDTSWDTKWIGESKIYDGYYIAEWMIPLAAFKYKEGETKWRFNSYRFDTQDNESSTWINIPQNQFIFSLAYLGDMVFEKPLGKSKAPISLIPFVNTGTFKDFESDIAETPFKIGGDVKMTIGNSMNLDLTFNPDFSQIEVDQQVTNLTRFSIAFPERRQFFVENSDLFANFGDNRDSRTFFSRRIGIAENIDGSSIENDIIAGVRLSGKLTNNLRVGILSMQTAEDITNEIAATNNAVVALQQKLFDRSNLSFLFINKQATKAYDFIDNNDTNGDNDSYNRVLGLDYNLASKSNTWNGKYYFHKSFSPNLRSKDFSTGISTQYNSKKYRVRLSGLYVGENFRSDLGFIRRTDIFKINPQFERLFWPKKGIFNQHTFSFIPIVIWRPELDFKNSDRTLISRWSSNLINQSQLRLTMFNRYTFLFDEFDPTGSNEGIPLPINSEYNYTNLELEYQSDLRKNFSYTLKPSYGDFYNGTIFSFEGQFRLRIQPYFFASAQINYDKIDLPELHPDASIWLVGPRFDITFNKKLFWSTFVQYSNQRDNLGINTRLQWRFKPLSDLFIVYNDNYFVNIFSPRNRSLSLKFTYWLNI